MLPSNSIKTAEALRKFKHQVSSSLHICMWFMFLALQACKLPLPYTSGSEPQNSQNVFLTPGSQDHTFLIPMKTPTLCGFTKTV